MLIQLRIENHRSVRDEQVLSLVAAESLGDKNDARLIRPTRPDHALLPVIALYGANASGKTNVLGALGFMRSAVIHSYRFWDPDGGTPHEPFALARKANKRSLYEVNIVVGETRYCYGFVLSATRVEEEWLHAWPRGRKQLWFEREADQFVFGKKLPGENELIRSLTRPNCLFLSAAAQNNHVALMPIFAWFGNARIELHRGLFRPMIDQYSARLFANSRQLSFSLFPEQDETLGGEHTAIVQLLRAADIGVLDLKVTEPKKHDISASVARDRYRGSGRVHLRHQAEDDREVWLPLEAESAGTVTLLGMAIYLIGALREGHLVCIDELEASLHPMLALALVRLFNDPEHNPRGAQLIFTTHDTNLLGNVLGEPPLRRDQIWFTEKDRAGATKLYPLTDFHPRAQENLERGYLQGRYGAIPFLGRLTSEDSGAENP